MKKPSRLSVRGQAAAEMVVALPLLLLLAAGIFQFALLFICRVQFDHACGQAAREWAAGARRNSQIRQGVWFHLSPYQKFFEKNSVHVTPQGRSKGQDALKNHRSVLVKGMGTFSPFPERLPNGLFDYSNGDWVVSARMRSKPLFGTIFPRGVLFTTRLSILRHPGDAR